MNSQTADRNSSADPASPVEPTPAQTSPQAPNPLWLIAAAMAFFFTAAAFFWRRAEQSARSSGRYRGVTVK